VPVLLNGGAIICTSLFNEGGVVVTRLGDGGKIFGGSDANGDMWRARLIFVF
jgi:hypothetical protein